MKLLHGLILSAILVAIALPAFAGDKPVNLSLFTPVSIAKETEGFEWGFVNHAQHAEGLQLGFINYAQTLHGIQVGLVNIIKQDGFLPVFPFVNWSF